jgi:hypothetical protein
MKTFQINSLFVLMIYIISAMVAGAALAMTGIVAYLCIFMGAPIRPFIVDLLLVDIGTAIIVFMSIRKARSLNKKAVA